MYIKCQLFFPLKLVLHMKLQFRWIRSFLVWITQFSESQLIHQNKEKKWRGKRKHQKYKTLCANIKSKSRMVWDKMQMDLSTTKVNMVAVFFVKFRLEMGIPSYLIARSESFPRESINHQISSMNLFIYLFNNHFEKSTCLISCCQLEWNQLAWNHVRCYKFFFVAYGTTDRHHIIMFIFFSLKQKSIQLKLIAY